MISLFDDFLFSKAIDLLNAINEDLPNKEQYKPLGTFQEKGFNVFCASNKSKDLIMNVLDFEGNTPKGFSANWRNPELIKHDLQIKEFTK